MRNYDERMTRQSRDEALTLVRLAAVESFLKIKWTKFSGFRISLTKPVRIQRWKLGRRENIKRRRNKHTHSAPAIHPHPRNFITRVTESVGPIYFISFGVFFCDFLKQFLLDPCFVFVVGKKKRWEKCFVYVYTIQTWFYSRLVTPSGWKLCYTQAVFFWV
jgi:hypothetical protein